MGSNEGKTAIVTGGIKGVGLAIAQRLARSGTNLVIGYSSDEDLAWSSSTSLAGSRGGIVMLKTDIRHGTEVEALFKHALDRFGRIDVVIANAGVEIIDRSFGDLEEERMDRFVDTNVKGTFFTLQQAARHVPDGGRIIATSSTIALYPVKKAGIYASTRAAVRVMIEVLAKELGPRRVTVNSIAPGMVKSAVVCRRDGGHQPVSHARPSPPHEGSPERSRGAVVARRPGPWRSGRSRDGAPERSTQKMPWSTRRSSTRGTLLGLFGSNGAITHHSKSVRLKRLMPPR